MWEFSTVFFSSIPQRVGFATLEGVQSGNDMTPKQKAEKRVKRLRRQSKRLRLEMRKDLQILRKILRGNSKPA